MKFVIETTEEEFKAAMRMGWNEAYGEKLPISSFVLPPIGDLSSEPCSDDVMRALPYLCEKKIERQE